jgi:cytochrome c2
MPNLRLLAVLPLFFACREPDAASCIGLDLDGDGICDRENADFGRDAEVPPEGRANIYGLPPDQLDAVVERGFEHSLQYPVDVTGLLLPYQPLVNFFDPANEEAALFRGAFASVSGIDSLDALYADAGLLPFDPPELRADATEPWVQQVPDHLVDTSRMGVTVAESPRGQGLTFSCAACHTGRFLGRSVRGLTNRTPRANSFFVFGKDLLPNVPVDVFQDITQATDAEAEMIEEAGEHLRRVGLKEPAQLGLDTSLAQVALSLARRGEGPEALPDPAAEQQPRPNALETELADSKPMPWWTLKYKNRWLADGSIVEGNPVFTNFLWNEIGRGADLPALEAWLVEEAQAVDELTVAVFASQPPRWTDFFPADSIDLDAAKRGEVLFEATCSGCHGSYEKGWDDASLPLDEQLATVQVYYDATIGPVDVGTDPGRADGIAHLGPRLNELRLSNEMQTVVETQSGYVPPPLDGIFARYPYLHNNSVPTLCDLLLPADQRVSTFVQGPSEEAEDYDADCVGYPVGEAIPTRWERDGAEVVAEGPGLSNAGHDSFLRNADGSAAFTDDERADLIAFLKTL